MKVLLLETCFDYNEDLPTVGIASFIPVVNKRRNVWEYECILNFYLTALYYLLNKIFFHDH